MKKCLIGICMLFISVWAPAQIFSKASLQATGLTCALCSNAINKALLALPFVESVKSDIKSSSFVMTFKSDKEVVIDDIKQAVEDAGFSVGRLEMTAQLSQLELDKESHVKIGNDQFHFLNNKHQQLNGEYMLVLADKGFLTAKAFKKLSAQYKNECVKTGKTADCCLTDKVEPGSRVYHVTI